MSALEFLSPTQRKVYDFIKTVNGASNIELDAQGNLTVAESLVNLDLVYKTEHEIVFYSHIYDKEIKSKYYLYTVRN